MGNLELTAGPPTADPDLQVVTPGFKVMTVQVSARNVGSDIAGYMPESSTSQPASLIHDSMGGKGEATWE